MEEVLLNVNKKAADDIKEAESEAYSQADEMLKSYEDRAKSESKTILDDCERDVENLKSNARTKVEEAVNVSISTILGE